MTEAEWLACGESLSALDFVRYFASDRKLRLFAVAFCRFAWKRAINGQNRGAAERCLAAADVAERHADGMATDQELSAAYQTVIGLAAGEVAAPLVWDAAADAVDTGFPCKTAEEFPAVERWRCRALREIVNPFHLRAIHPSALSWNGGAVRKMAQAIYHEGRFADLPVLADALEDAGCTDAAILAHCRSGGEHVRGCWVIDLLLGKA